jgi:hypothetical protein
MMIGVKAPNNVNRFTENEKLPRKLLSFNAYPPRTSGGGSEIRQMYLNNDRKIFFSSISDVYDD